MQLLGERVALPEDLLWATGWLFQALGRYQRTCSRGSYFLVEETDNKQAVK